MQFLKKNIFLFFWIVAFIEIISQFFNYPIVHFIFKPLLLPILIAAILLKTWSSRYRRLIVTGAFFSFLGDVFLLLENKNPNFFIIGLICFLITHIFYSWYFLKIKKAGISLLKQKPYLLILALLYTAGLLILLIPHLKDLTIPVIIYACVLTIMLLCSLRAYNFLNAASRLSLILGAICFVISDSLLAINKFYAPFAAAGFLIMLTYCLAQYFILNGFIKSI
ncbi:MAG: lysoplasmalogenase [Ferruginibacter sp.]